MDSPRRRSSPTILSAHPPMKTTTMRPVKLQQVPTRVMSSAKLQLSLPKTTTRRRRSLSHRPNRRLLLPRNRSRSFSIAMMTIVTMAFPPKSPSLQPKSSLKPQQPLPLNQRCLVTLHTQKCRPIRKGYYWERAEVSYSMEHLEVNFHDDALGYLCDC